MKIFAKLLGAATASLALIGAADARIIVSGDSNIVNPTVGSFSQPVNPGNVQFFTNLISGGSNVVVLDQSGGTGSLASVASDLDVFYNALGGVSSTLLGGGTALSDANLAAADLLIAPLPDMFSAAEATAVSNFLNNGGTVFLLGDNDAFPSANTAINGLLGAIGSSMSIVSDAIDNGFNSALGARIVSDALTMGVSEFRYASTSAVTGGNALFFALDGRTAFVSASDSSMPEIPLPAAPFLFATGLAALGYVRRRTA